MEHLTKQQSKSIRMIKALVPIYVKSFTTKLGWVVTKEAIYRSQSNFVRDLPMSPKEAASKLFDDIYYEVRTRYDVEHDQVAMQATAKAILDTFKYQGPTITRDNLGGGLF